MKITFYSDNTFAEKTEGIEARMSVYIPQGRDESHTRMPRFRTWPPQPVHIPSVVLEDCRLGPEIGPLPISQEHVDALLTALVEARLYRSPAANQERQEGVTVIDGCRRHLVIDDWLRVSWGVGTPEKLLPLVGALMGIWQAYAGERATGRVRRSKNG